MNPGSLLATKMVKEGSGVDGSDLRKGQILSFVSLLSDEFADASGKYYDNDAHKFTAAHPDSANRVKSEQAVQAIEETLVTLLG